MWLTLTSVLQTSQNKNIIKAMLFDNVKVTDEFEIKQLFNNFFTGVATELESNIPTSNIDPLNLISRVDASLFLYPVTVNGCTNAFDMLKLTNAGFNQLPVKLYKSLKNVVSSVIASIANCWFSNGIFLNNLNQQL